MKQIFLSMISVLFLFSGVWSADSTEVQQKSTWNLFASWSFGWTHYDAKDLNQVMELLASQSGERGLRKYEVDGFDGHPRNAAVMGMQWKNWQLGLEAEFWVENFTQKEVPFYSDRDDDPRYGPDFVINCAMFRDPNWVPFDAGVSKAACLEGRETFTLIPLTLQLSYLWKMASWFHLSPGYGVGIMAGKTELEVKTDFLGLGARPDEHLIFSLYPGINLLQKIWVDWELKPASWVGIDLRTGWRFSKLDHLEVKDAKGESTLFELVLGEKVEDGKQIYIRQYCNGSQELILTSPENAVGTCRDSEGQKKDSYHLVQGDFSGWYAAMKLNLYWGL